MKKRNSNKKKVVRILSCLLSVIIAMNGMMLCVRAEDTYPDLALDCKSAVLMEAQTGKILYANNENEALPPASVTKVMTLLLIMEAIEQNKIAYTDMVTASENACSMGGSQIYLEAGEQMSVEDLVKSVVIASANDAAVTLAEYIAGTESAFVDMMNAKAGELGMVNTNFENTNGLDDTTTNHVTSAKDIAIMSRELIKYPKITEYSSIWMDTVRNGEFGLTNTNRLIRFYKGATGLKTGSTSKAGFCITATAERDGMTLIAVIMASPSRDARNSAAVSLLNYGFSNFALYKSDAVASQDVKVIRGTRDICHTTEQDFACVMEKKQLGRVEKKTELPTAITAPVSKGQIIGKVTYTCDGKVLGTSNIIAAQSVDTVNFANVFIKMLSKIVLN